MREQLFTHCLVPCWPIESNPNPQIQPLDGSKPRPPQPRQLHHMPLRRGQVQLLDRRYVLQTQKWELHPSRHSTCLLGLSDAGTNEVPVAIGPSNGEPQHWPRAPRWRNDSLLLPACWRETHRLPPSTFSSTFWILPKTISSLLLSSWY